MNKKCYDMYNVYNVCEKDKQQKNLEYYDKIN